MSHACSVPLCPVVVDDLHMDCPLHRIGRQAKLLGIAKLKCAKCSRVFQKEDMVAPGTFGVYRHVACAPSKGKRKHERGLLLEEVG